MNVLSHFYYNLREEGAGELPSFHIGVAVPDLLSAIDRRAALDFERAEALARAPGRAAARAFWRGLSSHEAADRLFHAGPWFAAQTAALKQALRALTDRGQPLRRWFVAHVLLELLLDHRLALASPELPERLHALLEAGRGARIAGWLAPVSRREARGFAEAYARLRRGRAFEGYRRVDGVLAALERILARARQPALEAAHRERLRGMLPELAAALPVPEALAGFRPQGQA